MYFAGDGTKKMAAPIWTIWLELEEWTYPKSGRVKSLWLKVINNTQFPTLRSFQCSERRGMGSEVCSCNTESFAVQHKALGKHFRGAKRYLSLPWKNDWKLWGRQGKRRIPKRSNNICKNTERSEHPGKASSSVLLDANVHKRGW